MEGQLKVPVKVVKNGETFIEFTNGETVSVSNFLKQHCPIFVFPDNDPVRPISYPDYIENCSLYYHDRLIHKELSVDKLFDTTQETLQGVNSEEDRFPSKQFKDGWWLYPNEQGRLGLHRGDDVDKVPVYVRLKEDNLPDPQGSGSVPVFAIVYITYYGLNGSYFSCFGKHVGRHDADCEHCTVYVRKSDNTIFSVWYNAHSGHQGHYRLGEKVQFSTENRPYAYVAKSGHGTYPSPGIWWRVYGFANDITSKLNPDKRNYWDPAQNVVLLPECTCKKVENDKATNACPHASEDPNIRCTCEDVLEHKWLLFRGAYGFNGPQSPIYQAWYWFSENNQSISLPNRFFNPAKNFRK